MMPFCHLAGGLLAGAAFAPMPMIAFCAVGSVLPDRLDGMQAKPGDKDSFFAVHRGWSHNLGLWLGIAIACQLAKQEIPPDFLFTLSAAFWVCVGVLTHLCLDILNPTGIPIVPLVKNRLSLARIRTGSAFDYLIGAALLTGAAAIAAKRLGFLPDNLHRIF